MIGCAVLDTAVMPEGERFERYAAALGISHRAERLAGDLRTFEGRLDVWLIGAMVLAAGQQMALRLTRTDQQIRADGFDHVTLMMMREGSVAGAAAGPFIFGPNEVALFDLTQPMWAETTDNSTISARVPRELLEEAGVLVDGLHGTVLRGTAGRLLAEHFRTLLRLAPSIALDDVALVVRATMRLVATCATGQPSSPDRLAAISDALRARIERHVDENLADHRLDTAAICKALNLSRSTLYRTVGTGGIASLVRERRLQAVHDRLRSPVEQRSISQLAYDHGFTDAAHFGSAFRRRYGCSPRAMRQLGGSGGQSGKGAHAVYGAWLAALAEIDGVAGHA